MSEEICVPSSIDERINMLFDEYERTNKLPLPRNDHGFLARASVAYLGKRPETAYKILTRMNFTLVTRYVIPALADTAAKPQAIKILIRMGCSEEVLDQVIEALAYENIRPQLYEVLEKHGQKIVVTQALIKNLSDKKVGEYCYELLSKINQVSDLTVAELIKTLSKPESQTKVARLLIQYGAVSTAINKLVGYYSGDEKMYPVLERILISYGPKKRIVSSLVGALQNPRSKGFAKKMLKHFGPTEQSIYSLCGALQNQDRRDDAKEILLSFGPNKLTRELLRKTMQNQESAEYAKNVYEQYNGFGKIDAKTT